jgi:hypothetical protein
MSATPSRSRSPSPPPTPDRLVLRAPAAAKGAAASSTTASTIDDNLPPLLRAPPPPSWLSGPLPPSSFASARNGLADADADTVELVLVYGDEGVELTGALRRRRAHRGEDEGGAAAAPQQHPVRIFRYCPQAGRIRDGGSPSSSSSSARGGGGEWECAFVVAPASAVPAAAPTPTPTPTPAQQQPPLYCLLECEGGRCNSQSPCAVFTPVRSRAVGVAPTLRVTSLRSQLVGTLVAGAAEDTGGGSSGGGGLRLAHFALRRITHSVWGPFLAAPDAVDGGPATAAETAAARPLPRSDIAVTRDGDGDGGEESAEEPILIGVEWGTAMVGAGAGAGAGAPPSSAPHVSVSTADRARGAFVLRASREGLDDAVALLAGAILVGQGVEMVEEEGVVVGGEGGRGRGPCAIV